MILPTAGQGLLHRIVGDPFNIFKHQQVYVWSVFVLGNEHIRVNIGGLYPPDSCQSTSFPSQKTHLFAWPVISFVFNTVTHDTSKDLQAPRGAPLHSEEPMDSDGPIFDKVEACEAICRHESWVSDDFLLRKKIPTCQMSFIFFAKNKHMGVSENSGTPKSSIEIGFSIINHPFWGTSIFGNTHIYSSNHHYTYCWWFRNSKQPPETDKRTLYINWCRISSINSHGLQVNSKRRTWCFWWFVLGVGERQLATWKNPRWLEAKELGWDRCIAVHDDGIEKLTGYLRSYQQLGS